MAPIATTPGSRKRGRPRNDQSNTDSPVKKTRLASSTDTKKTTPGSLRSLSSAISKSFGYGQRKISGSGSMRNDKEPIDRIYEIPDSDEEEHRTRGKTLSRALRSPARHKNGDENGVYDFQGSDEEPSPAPTPSRSTRTTAPPSRSLSARNNLTKVTSNASPQVSGRGSTRSASHGSRQKVSGDREQAAVSEDDEEGNEGLSDSEDVLNTPSAARTSQKNGASLSKPNSATPKLKGILTPSRRLSERNPKSVAFNNAGKKSNEIFFADLPKKP